MVEIEPKPLRSDIGFFTRAGFVDKLTSGNLVHVPLAEPDLSATEIGLLIFAIGSPIQQCRLSPQI
ncbi:hypothetical protein GCM10007857_46240 [Bradyrhizobium iriomotense]|uniref:Uncharacterized protein n=1 Tax=Bradyrhizobium iriomotense TaxID=441950 RepID=A0ABQ6B0J6_9BRAD|nr:hypothetical protein GCM10007857_46240 [Bradyrhizobium iriomotense]